MDFRCEITYRDLKDLLADEKYSSSKRGLTSNPLSNISALRALVSIF
jgi:hypothetical protein